MPAILFVRAFDDLSLRARAFDRLKEGGRQITRGTERRGHLPLCNEYFSSGGPDQTRWPPSPLALPGPRFAFSEGASSLLRPPGPPHPLCLRLRWASCALWPGWPVGLVTGQWPRRPVPAAGLSAKKASHWPTACCNVTASTPWGLVVVGHWRASRAKISGTYCAHRGVLIASSPPHTPQPPHSVFHSRKDSITTWILLHLLSMFWPLSRASV